MQVIKNNTVFFDVDDTLVLTIARTDNSKGLLRTVDIFDPVEKKLLRMYEHSAMVRLLKEEHHRGSFVVVWSRGGHAWAREVLRALDLTDYVHLAMDKPMVYFDDSDMSKWLPYRVYLEPDFVYKK